MSATLFIWTGAGTSRIRAAGTLYPDIELPTEAKSKLEWAHPPALPLFAVIRNHTDSLNSLQPRDSFTTS